MDHEAPANLLASRRSRREFAPGGIARSEVESLLQAGLSHAGDGQRTVPSAGALYPLHLFIVAIDGLAPGLYPWSTVDGFPSALSSGDLSSALHATALEDQPWVGKAPALIVIAADLEKANTTFHGQQPDGLRGERYAAIETGAVAQSISLMAEARGLAAVLIGGIGTDAISPKPQAVAASWS